MIIIMISFIFFVVFYFIMMFFICIHVISPFKLVSFTKINMIMRIFLAINAFFLFYRFIFWINKNCFCAASFCSGVEMLEARRLTELSTSIAG